MKLFPSNRDSYLERAISELRAEQLDAKTLAASAERVWERLEAAEGAEAARGAGSLIRGCTDIRALLPAFHKQELTAARALIVEDHLRECVACRSYVQGRDLGAESGKRWQLDAAPRGWQWSFRRWALAGAALPLLAAMMWVARAWYFAPLPGSRGQIASLQGQVYSVGPERAAMLKQGDEIGDGEFVRTAAGSHAVLRLSDGSKVEMNQRAEFAVSANRRDTTIHLNQGSIIVHAAKRRTGRLYVRAPDCTVAVTGTLFSVNSGIKGSRVSVVEGQVHVKHAGKESILYSGDQLATTQTVGLVPVPEEIAWSDDLDHELALLAEFSTLRKKLEEIPTPAPRYQSAILPLLPRETVLYIGIPNLGDALQQANQIFQEQLAQSAVLQQWWNRNGHANEHPTLGELIQQIQTLSQYLGEEVVITMSGVPARGGGGPVLLSEVKQPGLENFLQNHFASSLSDHPDHSNIHIVDSRSLSSLADGTNGMIMLVRPNMLVVGATAGAVRRMNAQLDGRAKLFDRTDFGQRILSVYGQGAETVLAVNFAEILNTVPQDNSQAFQNSGFNNIEYLLATHGAGPRQSDNRITMEFNGERRGLASWLAAPAPMGSLDYVSLNAGAAVSFVGKQPALMLDDLFGVFAASEPDFNQSVEKTNAELGLDIRNDLASALGGEITLALDGPVLPTPSWKMIVEVNNPGALELAIEKLVEDAGREAQKSNQPVSLTLEQQQAGGRTFYAIHAQRAGLASEYDYVFADGYMIMGPSRALLLAALDTHTNGTSLARSPSFRALLPSDKHANFSGMLYQNLSPILQPLASQVSSGQFALLQQLAADSKPSLMCAYGESDRIEVASSGKLLDMNPGIMTLFHLLGPADHGTSHRANP